MATKLLGASLPRSGHHHLARLLEGLLGDRLATCEWYTPPGCCRAVPCTRPAAVTFQKNHDFDLSLPTDAPGCHYVVQHREPVGRLASEWEFHLADLASRGVPGLVDDHEFWLGLRCADQVAFMAKWVVRPPEASTVIDYADLEADPAAVLRRLATDAALGVDDEAIGAAVAAADEVGRDTHHRGGDPLDRPGFDAGLLARAESLVLDELGVDAPRRLEVAAYEGSVLEAAYRAASAGLVGDRPTERAVLEAARSAHPGNAALARAAAVAASAAGDDAAVLAHLLAAERVWPDHPDVLAQLANRAAAAGDWAGALSRIRRVAAVYPAEPAHAVLLALVLAKLGDPGAATAVAEARALGPTDAEHLAILDALRRETGG